MGSPARASHYLGLERVQDRPFHLCVFTNLNPSVLAVRAASAVILPVQPFARVNTAVIILSLPSINPPTNQIPFYTPHKHRRHIHLASAIRDPARSALKRDIRALTSPPAWLAVLCCAALRCAVLYLPQRPLNACLYSFARDK